MKNKFQHDPELSELIGDLTDLEEEQLPPVRRTEGGFVPDYSAFQPERPEDVDLFGLQDNSITRPLTRSELRDIESEITLDTLVGDLGGADDVDDDVRIVPPSTGSARSKFSRAAVNLFEHLQLKPGDDRLTEFLSTLTTGLAELSAGGGQYVLNGKTVTKDEFLRQVRI